MSGSDRGSRVVITGMGLVSPLGNTPDALWDALSSGRSGVERLTSLPVENLTTSFAGEARGFTGDIADFGPLDRERQKQIRKALKLMCRETQIGVAAAQLALADAGLPGPAYAPERIGVVYGSDYMMTLPEEFSAGVAKCRDESGKFEFPRWGDEGMSQLAPLWLLKYLPNMPASHVAIFNDLRGPSNSHTLREASSNLAIGEAASIIARGAADAILAGATGTRVHPLRSLHTMLQEEIAGNGVEPAKASRPFDLHRAGMVLGEGAGAVVLERLETAKARGAKIYGEILGYGCTADAYRITDIHPEGRGAVGCMTAALKDANLNTDQIHYINAHGTSTQVNDRVESLAIKTALGEAAYKTPVSSTKSEMGHLIAAAGATELIICLMTIRDNTLPPTINYETPDPDCDLDYIPNVAREKRVRHALSNSFGFGGQNISLIVSLFDK
jgi:3-oxoacyl-[acyl-carrier-protein] synthase II